MLSAGYLNDLKGCQLSVISYQLQEGTVKRGETLYQKHLLTDDRKIFRGKTEPITDNHKTDN